MRSLTIIALLLALLDWIEVLGATKCGDGSTDIPSEMEAGVVFYPHHYYVSADPFAAGRARPDCKDVLGGQTLMTLRSELEYDNLMSIIKG